MKDLILTVLCVVTLMVSGCTKVSHSGTLTATGKVFKVGGEAYNLLYVNGMVHMDVVRENTESIVETNDSDGLGDPADIKTVRTIRYKAGPIVSGYLVDLAKASPEAAQKYVEKMPEMNQSTIEPVKTEPAKESSSIVKPILQKIKDAIGGDDQAKVIVGDGTYTALAKDRSIKYQSSLCTELLAYADDTTEMPSSGETIKSSLVHFAGRLGQLVAKKKDVTKMRISKATIQNGKLTYLIYLLERDDGTEEEVECPSCYEVED